MPAPHQGALESRDLAPPVARSRGPLKLLADVWQARWLLRRFAVRDLQLKYRHSRLGFLWSLVSPLLLMAVYTVVFSIIIRLRTEEPYPLFLLAGLLPWLFTSHVLERSSAILLEQSAFLQKVYIPREVLIFSLVVVQVVELLLALLAFLPVASIWGYPPGWSLLALPFVLLMQALLLSGLALTLAVGTVFFRDLLHLVSLGLQVWFYLTPILFPAAFVLEMRFGWLEALNPMAGLILAWRAVLIQSPWPPLSWAISSVVLSLLFFWWGAWIFCRFESRAIKEL